MDSSKKPKNENPGKKASLLSRLFIFWIVPLLFRGHRAGGLTADDLCKCIDDDISEQLGDKLQRYVCARYVTITSTLELYSLIKSSLLCSLD